MTIKVWHCHNARSLQVLWALEEMDMDYEVVAMPFPPRISQPEFLQVNELGTIPYMIDGDTHMTESSAIPLYLVERYGRHEFGLRPDHPEYGDYLNWLFHSDATLTFPQTVFIRYMVQEPPERGLQEAATIMRSGFTRACAGSIAPGRWPGVPGGQALHHRRHRYRLRPLSWGSAGPE